MTDNERQNLIEGYKALMQYGVQLSQDHVNYDKIIMPLSLVPAYFVLTSSDLQEAGPVAELLIWSAGPLLLWFWHTRNKRSKDRLYKVWDTVSCIEKRLCFAAYSTVRDYMKNKSKTLRDFEIKALFVWFAGLGYFVVLCFLLWRWSTC